MTEMEIALMELESIIQDRMTGQTVEWQTEIMKLMERFNRQMMVIEVVEIAALVLAVFCLCWAIFLMNRRGKHGRH